MAKWELKYYWDDGLTIECRYFNTMKESSPNTLRKRDLWYFQPIICMGFVY